MKRRELLFRSTGLLLLLPFGWRCGGGAADSGGLTITSLASNGHSHKVTVPQANLDSPPSAGATLESTVEFGHRHTVSLTEAELKAIAAGEAVNKTSSSSDGHNHLFTFQKAASQN
jgi:hypothetical protein